jgi:hypothetical protein
LLENGLKHPQFNIILAFIEMSILLDIQFYLFLF